MNELIFELAEQADAGYTGIDDDNMGHALVGEEAIKKFAELIVKETLRITGAPPSMVETVKKHFGVEE